MNFFYMIFKWILNDNVSVQQRTNGAEVIVCHNFGCWFWLELMVAKYFPANDCFSRRASQLIDSLSLIELAGPIKDCSKAMSNWTRLVQKRCARAADLQVRPLLADGVQQLCREDYITTSLWRSCTYMMWLAYLLCILSR